MPCLDINLKVLARSGSFKIENSSIGLPSLKYIRFDSGSLKSLGVLSIALCKSYETWIPFSAKAITGSRISFNFNLPKFAWASNKPATVPGTAEALYPVSTISNFFSSKLSGTTSYGVSEVLARSKIFSKLEFKGDVLR